MAALAAPVFGYPPITAVLSPFLRSMVCSDVRNAFFDRLRQAQQCAADAVPACVQFLLVYRRQRPGDCFFLGRPVLLSTAWSRGRILMPRRWSICVGRRQTLGELVSCHAGFVVEFLCRQPWHRFPGISAMRNMHVTIATLLACLGWGVSRTWGIAATLFALAIAIGAIHLGWHYASDVIAGAVLAVLFWVAAGWVSRYTGWCMPVANRPVESIACRRAAGADPALTAFIAPGRR